MRDERYPLWEEPVNQNGGTWRLKCHKSDTVSIKIVSVNDINNINDIILTILGEDMERDGTCSYRRTIC